MEKLKVGDYVEFNAIGGSVGQLVAEANNGFYVEWCYGLDIKGTRVIYTQYIRPSEVHLVNKETYDLVAMKRFNRGTTEETETADYQKVVMSSFSRVNRRRCEALNGFNHDLNSWSLSDWLTATAGELGEAANVIKKLNRVRDGINGNTRTEEELRKQLRMELADTFIYLDLLAQAAGINLEAAVIETFNNKSAEIGYPKWEFKGSMQL